MDDTTFKPIPLNYKLPNEKVINYAFNKKVLLQFNYNDFAYLCNLLNSKSDDFGMDYSKNIHYLDSVSKLSDTILLPYDMANEFIVYYMLMCGHAMVYDNNAHKYVKTIYYRLERFGSVASSFLYLPNKESFFSNLCFTGILDDATPVGVSPNEKLEELGRKLRETKQ